MDTFFSLPHFLPFPEQADKLTPALLLQLARSSLHHLSGDLLVSQRCRDWHPSFSGRLHVFAIGKAGLAMARGFEQGASFPSSEGLRVIVIPSYTTGFMEKWTILRANHPLPDTSSLHAGQLLTKYSQQCQEGDHVLVLLSGGTSSLVALPLEGITLSQKRSWTNHLLRTGADIHTINTWRKALSRWKGGGWLNQLAPAFVETWAISDVSHQRWDSIGSGPTIPHRLTSQPLPPPPESFSAPLPPPLFQKKAQPPPWPHSSFHILASNAEWLQHIQALATPFLSSPIHCFEEGLTGDINAVKERIQHWMHRCDTPSLGIWGGEPTLEVQGTGKGGRMQHLALALVPHLAHPSSTSCLLAIGSDGRDGPTDAQGALITAQTDTQARNLGLTTSTFLQSCNSYEYHARLQTQLPQKETHTNVRDLLLFWYDPCA